MSHYNTEIRIDTKPPKNRAFLGLVRDAHCVYWNKFHWLRDPSNLCRSAPRTGNYVDSELDDMPPIVAWAELPTIPIVDSMKSIQV